MGIYSKFMGLVGAALIATAAAAPAATLSVVGGTAGVVSAKFSPNAPTGVSVGDAQTSFRAAADGGMIGGGLMLTAVGKTKVTLTYLGKEAAAKNLVVETVGGQFLSNKTSAVGSSFVFNQFAGFVKFLFSTNRYSPTGTITNGGASTNRGLGLAFSHVTGNSAIAMFDDSNGATSGGDRDYDDMVVRINVQSVPLPAGGLLLLSGLGGLVVARRRKSA